MSRKVDLSKVDFDEFVENHATNLYMSWEDCARHAWCMSRLAMLHALVSWARKEIKEVTRMLEDEAT